MNEELLNSIKDLTSKISTLNESVGALSGNVKESSEKVEDQIESSSTDRKQTNDALNKIIRMLPDSMQSFYRKQEKQNPLAAKLGALGVGITALSKSMFRLESALFSTQKTLKTTIGTSNKAFAEAIYSSITSAGGLRITRDENIQARAAFSDEFGTVLARSAAVEFAREGKKFGVDTRTRAAATRSFLDTGSRRNAVMVERRFIKTFQESGLKASAALEFAAQNANLIAIAGTRYANELSRAAASAKIIGVELKTTEDFADSIVGDFEGALERMSELRALGFEIDINRVMRTAAIGDPESFRKELSSQLSKNADLLGGLQTNRFLRLAIEKDLGMSISDVTRLSGVETPGYQTQMEDSADKLGIMANISQIAVGAGIFGAALIGIASILRLFGVTLSSVVASATTTRAALSAAATAGTALSTAAKTATTSLAGTAPAANRLSTYTNMASAALRRFATTLSTHPGAIPYSAAGLYSPRTAYTIPGGAMGTGGTAKGTTGSVGKTPKMSGPVGIGALSMAGMIAVNQMGIENQYLNNALQMGLLGASLGSMMGPQAALIGAGIGSVVGLGMAGLSHMKMGSGMAAGGLVKGPGSATSDNILTPLSSGEYVINAKAVKSYGTDFLDSVNSRGYQGEAGGANVLEEKMEKLSEVLVDINSQIPNMIANALKGIRVEMDGNSVGKIVYNSFTPIERYSSI